MSGGRGAVGPPGVGVLELARRVLSGAGGAPAWPQFPVGRTVLTHQGRAAIRAGCAELGFKEGDEVLVPAYNCGTEVEAVLAAGARVKLYRVDESARIDPDDLRARVTGRTRAVYVIHYFGWPQDLATVQSLCRERGLLLLEDCALALFSADGDVPLGRAGDLAFFSLTKTLAVPDGGALVARPGARLPAAPMPRPPASRILRASLGLLRRRWRRRFGGRRAEVQPAAAPRPDMPANYYWNDATGRRCVSRTTRALLAGVRPADLVARRRANYARLLERLGGLRQARPLFGPLPPGVCPLEMPVRAADPARVHAALARRGVTSIRWWSGYHRALPWDEFPDACTLKDTIVALPVHQDLDDHAVDRVANALAMA